MMQSMRLWLVFLAAAPGIWAQPGGEVFEKRIRPLLAERGFACRGAKSNPPRANLRLDTRAGLRSVVAPRDAARTRLYSAIGYTHPDLRMPPTGKLPDEDIAAFRAWIDAGATDPRPDRPAPQPAANRLSDPTLACGFRAFQPLHAGPPPAVDDSKWPPNSATDSVKSRADTVDNRIDVLGKTFLGRCPR